MSKLLNIRNMIFLGISAQSIITGERHLVRESARSWGMLKSYTNNNHDIKFVLASSFGNCIGDKLF